MSFFHIRFFNSTHPFYLSMHAHTNTHTHSKCWNTAAAPWPEAKGAEAYGLLGAKHVQSWSFCDGGINGWRGETERCQGKSLPLFQLRRKLLTNKCKWTNMLNVLCKIWCLRVVQPDVCQSLNFFSFSVLDLAMQLNQGKFEYNGSCGWEQLLTPVFFSFPSNPYPSFNAPLWSSSIKACHIPLVVATGDQSYCLLQEPMSALGKLAHLHSPLRLSAIIYLFLSPSPGSNTVPKGRDFTANAENLICGKIRVFADSNHY